MKFIFWQNILSPHQSDFISALADEHDVTLVVMSRIDNHRKGQNWQAKYSDKVNIIVSPSLMDIIQIIHTANNKTHCFSGFFAYPKISFALFLSCIYRKTNIVLSEAVSSNGLINKCKLYIRKSLTLLFSGRIYQVFAIGTDGVNYFKQLGFLRSKLSEFGYFVSPPETVKRTGSQPYIVFVGRLIPLKGIIPLLDMCKKLKSKGIAVKIIGGGPLKATVISFLEEHRLDFVELLSDMPRERVMKIIGNASSLLLPNIGDEGWGVVLNEALLQGTPVICSLKTGANVVVVDEVQGRILTEVTSNELLEAVRFCSSLNHEKIKAMALKSLKPEIGAKYFVRQMSDSRSSNAPWFKGESN